MRVAGRVISPVVGVVLMVAVTLVLAATIAGGLLVSGSNLDERREEFEAETNAVQTATGNPWEGSVGDLLRPSTRQAGATDVRYRVNFTIRPGSNTVGNSLNSVRLEVVDPSSPSMFANTVQADLERVVVDENSDGTTDQVITGDVDSWQVQNGGTELKIGFSGAAYTADGGDSIVVVFDGVDNPGAAGTYDIEAETSGDGNIHTGTVTIV